MQNPQRNIAKLARRRVLVVITARTRAGGYVLLSGIACSCILAPENHMDVLKTRCEEQARCNSPLYLDRGVGVCFGKARSHPHAASRPPLLMTVSARCRLPKPWAEANPLEPCECGVADGTIVIIVYTTGFLISRPRKLEAVASPAQRNQHG